MLTKDLPTGVTFGELALLYDAKRSASIVANDECQCWTLDGTIFKTEIAKSSIAQRKKRADFLDSIALFDPLDKFRKLKLIDGLTTVIFQHGDMVFNEGDSGQEFYIIESGSCECLKVKDGD